METKLEVVVVPVSDVDRAVQFYQGLGWRLDGDYVTSEDLRVIQLTPPGSACSVIIGTGLIPAAPGSAQGLHLVVTDLNAARDELGRLGTEVSEVFHDADGVPGHSGSGRWRPADRVPGPDPENRSYRSLASFCDPDGNGWLLQEITTRLPGR